MNKLKSSELIAALEEGFLLEKDFHDEDPRQYEKGECKQYVYRSVLNDEILFEYKGWGSTAMIVYNLYGNPMYDILTHPKKWKISSNSIHELPWLQKFKNQ